jgi:hypothetical protein
MARDAMSSALPVRLPRDTPMARLVDDCIRTLIAPWNSRNRYESQVIGAIELAFRRGFQAGQESKDQ